MMNDENERDDDEAVHESDAVRAVWDGNYLHVTLKAAKQTVTLDPRHDKPKPVTDPRYLDALKKKGIDPETRRSYGRVVIPREDAEAIAQMVESPQLQQDRLLDKRRSLAQSLSYALDEEADRRRESIERASESGRYSKPAPVDVESRRKAIEDFDREHPEVLERIKRENKERAERHVWD